MASYLLKSQKTRSTRQTWFIQVSNENTLFSTGTEWLYIRIENTDNINMFISPQGLSLNITKSYITSTKNEE